MLVRFVGGEHFPAGLDIPPVDWPSRSARDRSDPSLPRLEWVVNGERSDFDEFEEEPLNVERSPQRILGVFGEPDVVFD